MTASKINGIPIAQIAALNGVPIAQVKAFNGIEIPGDEPPPTGILFYDTFTAPNGTELTDHTPDVGGPWLAIGAQFQIQDNKAQRNPAATSINYVADVGEPDYTARYDITFGTAVIPQAESLLFAMRGWNVDFSPGSLIVDIANSGGNFTVLIREITSGAPRLILPAAGITAAPGAEFPCQFYLNGTEFSWFINDGEVAGSTDLLVNNARGEIGIWNSTSGGGGDPPTRIDNILLQSLSTESEAYVEVSTPWRNGVPAIGEDYELDRLEDITGNQPGVNPNELLVAIYCDQEVVQALQTDTRYVLEPNTYIDLENPGSELNWPPTENFFDLYRNQKIGTGEWNQGQLIQAIGQNMNGRSWAEVHQELLSYLQGLTP